MGYRAPCFVARWLLALGATVAAGLPAVAGDRALIDVIGFSDDARYFAFEEFGIQDGSGFAYANVYVVDLKEDRWVVGTPVRVQAEDEAATLAEIRAQAMDEAEEDIVTLGIDRPAQTLALIGDGAPDADGQTLAFGMPGYDPGDVTGLHELRLESFFTTASSPCAEWFSVEPMGYELVLAADGAPERVVHRDGNLPRSRGCPFTYRLYGVVAPFNSIDPDEAVAIISYYPGGFEGPDRRFLAVPLGQ